MAPGAAVPQASPANPLAAQGQSKAWILGIARFALAKAGGQPSALQDSLPRLILSDLKVLPLRHTPESVAKEAGARDVLRAHFVAGDDLASKLDARALRFLDPSSDQNARNDALAAAEKLVADSTQKLADLDIEKLGAPPPSAPSDRETRLWDGHSKGLLIDIPSSSLFQAAKTAGVDLLVTGTIALQSGYAIVQVRGFDSLLEREVFAWKSYCSADDPAPSAREICAQLERWVAGRDFARLDLSLKPSSTELRVDDQSFQGALPVFYVYAPASLRIEASAAGYATRVIQVDLALGERKSLSLELEPRVTGRISLTSDPEGAAVSLDSVPIGRSPVAITLDGSRGIATLSATGREPQSIVLPSAGEAQLAVSLLPSDGLGPAGRISTAKDSFYQSLGWFVLSLPVSMLGWGAFHAYDEAYGRSGDTGLLVSRDVTIGALSLAIAATASAATFMILRLVKYLGAAH